MRNTYFSLSLGLCLLLAAPGLLAGQDPPVVAPPTVTPPPELRGYTTSQIVSQIQQAGISRQEAQQRLREAGRSADLADPYFDIIESGADPGRAGLPDPDADVLQAFQGIGVLEAADTPAVDPDTIEEEVTEVRPDPTPEERPVRVFGREVFSGVTSEFQPLVSGPVDPSYRLGPGDQVVLIMTGDVERAHQLEINREGFVVIPQVGQIFVNGLTMKDLEDVLFHRLGQAFSGVRRGPDATTHFTISLGQLRRNQVYMLGELEQRGAVQVSSVATLFNALYAGGGPSRQGSFRRIQVRRHGELIQETDVYDYLLTGSTKADIRLENGDVVFVPLTGRQVTVRGQVRRPAIFELMEGEEMLEALAFAGGFRTDAFTNRIQIDRILPPEERLPGRERVLIDVDPAVFADPDANVELKDGDVVRVFSISDERLNRVTLRGDVFRPGTYEYRPGMTLGGLLERAEGLLPTAYRPVAHVIRVDHTDGSHYLKRVTLPEDSLGVTSSDFYLSDLDEVVIYGRAAMRDSEWVEVDGPVRNPGRYPFAKGMTLKDLVLAAGGATDDLLPTRAHISRERKDLQRELLRLEVHPDRDGIPRAEIPLRSRDRVSLFDQRQMILPRRVTITGLIREPGDYPLADNLTVQDLILSAGGFSRGAYAVEIEVARPRIGHEREDSLVTVHRVEMKAPDNTNNPGDGERDGARARTAVDDWLPGMEEFKLEDGDAVFVRRLPGYVETRTVSLGGEVIFPGSYALERRGERLSQLVERAGGLTPEAYVPGARLIRDETLVTIDLEHALNRPAGRADIALFPGDRLVVPEYDPTVLVQGEVGFTARIPYRRGWKLRDYVDRVGGYTENADTERVRIVYPNGEAATRRGFIITFAPEVKPGSVIQVPTRSPTETEGVDWDRFLTRTLSVASTLATVMIAVDRLGR